MSLEKAPRTTVSAQLHILSMGYGAFLFCVVVISKISIALCVLVCTLVHMHTHTQSLSINFFLTPLLAKRH